MRYDESFALVGWDGPRCRQVFIVVTEDQSIEDVLTTNPGLIEQFPLVGDWGLYSQAAVYLARPLADDAPWP